MAGLGPLQGKGRRAVGPLGRKVREGKFLFFFSFSNSFQINLFKFKFKPNFF
jgi:hypothetical protein